MTRTRAVTQGRDHWHRGPPAGQPARVTAPPDGPAATVTVRGAERATVTVLPPGTVTQAGGSLESALWPVTVTVPRSRSGRASESSSESDRSGRDDPRLVNGKFDMIIIHDSPADMPGPGRARPPADRAQSVLGPFWFCTILVVFFAMKPWHCRVGKLAPGSLMLPTAPAKSSSEKNSKKISLGSRYGVASMLRVLH